MLNLRNLVLLAVYCWCAFLFWQAPDPAEAIVTTQQLGVTQIQGTPAIIFQPCSGNESVKSVGVVDVGANEFVGGGDDRALWQVEARRAEPIQDKQARVYPVGEVPQGFTESVPLRAPLPAEETLAAVVNTEVDHVVGFSVDELRPGEIVSETSRFSSTADFRAHVLDDNRCGGDHGLFLGNARLEAFIILGVGAVVVGGGFVLFANLVRESRRRGPSSTGK